MTRRVGTHLLTALTCSGLLLSASAFHRAPALPVTVELRGGTLVSVVLRSSPACLDRQRWAGRDLTFQDGPTRLHIEAASIRTLTVPTGLTAPSTLTACPDFIPAHWTIHPGAPSVLHRRPSLTLTVKP